jgi:urea transport system ATP-binding protein
MLKITNLSSGYGESMIINGLNFEIKKGEVVALIGKNGAGKTTLLKTIMGLIKEKSGEIYFDGNNIKKTKPEQRALLGMAYVPQGREIFPYLTVHENLILGLEARGKKAKDIPPDIYELFPELKSLEDRRGGDLSGGQQQQLAIARMLINEPKILLLDEPTEGIQPSIVFAIETAIRMIKEQKNISIILVEQFMEFALRLSDTCYLMEKGNFVFREETTLLDAERIKSYLVL